MKITILGQIFNTSGYSQHVRSLSKALNRMCDVKLTTQLWPGWENQVDDETLAMITKEDSMDRTNIIISLPHDWPIYTTKKKNCAWLVWEGDRLPKSWLDNLADERIILIFVPSQHVWQAVKNTTTDQNILNKLRLVPHGADRSVFYPEEKKDHKDEFVFLCNKGFRHPGSLDRGGIMYAIQAFLEEFGPEEKVRLVLKFNPAYFMGVEAFQAWMAANTTYTGSPPISINADPVDANGLRTIYNNSDVFLSPSLAEAFNMPCLEAMAAGKPVITTSFGGQTDYVNDQNGWLVPGKLYEVRHELLYESIFWMRPDMAELKKIMRYAFEHREEVERKGQNALKDSKDLTWTNSATLALQHLKEIATEK